MQAPPKILAASQPPANARPGDNAVSVRTERDSEGLHLTFSFAAATPAALFRRADTVWLVFDSTTPIDLEPIRSSGGSIVADVSLLPLDKGRGGPHSAQPSANAVAHGQHDRRRRELDADLRRYDADADRNP